MLFKPTGPSQCIWCTLRQISRHFSISSRQQRQQQSRRLWRPARAGTRLCNVAGQQQHPRRRIEADSSGDDQPSKFPVSIRKVAPGRGESKLLEEILTVELHLTRLQENAHKDPIIQRLQLNKEQVDHYFKRLKRNIGLPAPASVRDNAALTPLLERMRGLAGSRDMLALDRELKYAFYGMVLSSRTKQSEYYQQEKLLNLGFPSEWFPRTRGYEREFHVHVGPTNSGKTYHALKRLEEANKGVYAGPLRLLAHEVYMRLNARGKPCMLVTGDERSGERDSNQEPIDPPMTSCTVEMLSFSTAFDVAVIDEIQMLASEDRGWAWTHAVLGVMAKEVHLCGEERAVPIIQELVAACGDRVVIHRYERLSPLRMMDRSLNGNLASLQKGDCVVGFSIVVLHSLRQLIERTLQKKCAIIYGSLPPETRAQQAKLFNDPNNDYDFLVASNAVGMGLNLNIKRLVFKSAHRNVGGRLGVLSAPEIKQIAGRAGRYSTASDDMEAPAEVQKQSSKRITDYPSQLDELESTSQIQSEANETSPVSPSALSALTHPEGLEPPQPTLETATRFTETYDGARSTHDREKHEFAQTSTRPKSSSLGLVTTLEKHDHRVVARAMNNEPEPITQAGILPPKQIIERFARYFPPETPLSYVLFRLNEVASTSRRFRLCDVKTQMSIADAIEDVDGLTISNRLKFCFAPVSTRREGETELVQAYARMVGSLQGASVLDIEELDLDLLGDDLFPNRDYLRKLERLHKGILIFLWLSFRFTGIFLDQTLAIHVKSLVEKRIQDTLARLSFDYQKIRKRGNDALLSMLEDVEDSREAASEDADLESALDSALAEHENRTGVTSLNMVEELSTEPETNNARVVTKAAERRTRGKDDTGDTMGNAQAYALNGHAESQVSSPPT